MYVARNAAAEVEAEGPVRSSLRAVSTIILVLRLLLLARYLYMYTRARKVQAPLRFIKLVMVGLAMSSLCWTIALATSYSAARSVNIARVSFWVLGLNIETVFTIIAAASSSALLIELEWWAERMAALTLIIIGEGIIGIYEQFSIILSGPNSGRLASVYGSIFAVVGLYRILFGDLAYAARDICLAYAVLQAYISSSTRIT